MVRLFHPAALAAGAGAPFPATRAPIRMAGIADRPALAALAFAAFSQGPALLPAGARGQVDAARFSALFSGPGPLLVAEVGDVPLGCALAEEPPEGGDVVARLTGLWVAPQAMGQGVGSTLLAAMEELLALEGAATLRVRVPSGHLRALGLFRRRGYVMQAAGQRAEAVSGVPLPHTMMTKRLPALAQVA